MFFRPPPCPPAPDTLLHFRERAQDAKGEEGENSIHQSFTVWTAATAKEEKRRIKIDPGLLRTEGREGRKHGPFVRRESIPLPLELTVLSRKKRRAPCVQGNFFFRFLRPFTSKLGRKALYSISRFAPPVFLIVTSAYVRKFLHELGKRGRTSNSDLVLRKLKTTFPDICGETAAAGAHSISCDDRNMASFPPVSCPEKETRMRNFENASALGSH